MIRKLLFMVQKLSRSCLSHISYKLIMEVFKINQVYQKKSYKVYSTKDKNEFVVHNSDMVDFAHTHIRNFNTAKYLIELSINKKIPYDLPKYLVISLIRINQDMGYITKLKEVLAKSKKDMYYNANKGIRK